LQEVESIALAMLKATPFGSAFRRCSGVPTR